MGSFNHTVSIDNGVAFLEEVREELKSGEAYDRLSEFLDEPTEEAPVNPTQQDCDSVFRCLVVDEGWTVERAEKVYHALVGMV